jgi:Ankyrin repeats (3 copies)
VARPRETLIAAALAAAGCAASAGAVRFPSRAVVPATTLADITGRLLAAGMKVGREAALLAAVERGDEATTRALLAAGVSPDVRNLELGQRPLHLAAEARTGSLAVVEILIQAGADVNALDRSDHMPLQSALLACNVPVAQRLVQARADRAWARADDITMDLVGRVCPAEAAALTQLLSR